MKNSFVMYTEYSEHVELLSMAQRGQLFTGILYYAGGLPLPEMDAETRMAFSFIRARMDRDSLEYKKKIEARREAGKKGGRPPKGTEAPRKPNVASGGEALKPNGYFAFSEKPNKSDENQNNPDTVPVPVLVSDNEKDKNIYVKQKTLEYPYKAVVDYLNQKAGTAFKDQSKDSRKHIKARFDEGYTLQDFYRVIDIKTAEWIGTEQAKYLRPSTLFGTKFESYLNQKTINKKKNTFHNFSQHEYDYDAMVREINGF